MNNILADFGKVLLAFSPIVGVLLVFLAIVTVGKRHDDRVDRERERQALLRELQQSDLKKAIAVRARQLSGDRSKGVH